MNETERDFFKPVEPAQLKEELTLFGFEMETLEIIKVDLDTPLEQFVKFGAYSLLILNVLLAKFPFYLLKALGWLLTGFFLILMKNVDNYYLVNLKDRALYYQFYCLIPATQKKLASFSDIVMVTVSSSPMGYPIIDSLRQWSGQVGKQVEEITPIEIPPDGLWEYVPMVILKTGQMVYMGDWQKEGFYVANRKAQLLAQAMNVPFLPCPRKGVAIVLGGFEGTPVSVIHRVDHS